MKHTEEEAKTKECRMAGTVHLCSGSACMGWVWTDKEGHPKRKGMCGYLTNINVNAHFAVPQQQRPPLIGRG